MAANLAAFLVILKRKVPDGPARFNDTERNAIIGEAVNKYSLDRPRKFDTVLTGEEPNVQEYAVPADWTSGLSNLLSVEHPVDNVPPSFLDPQDNVLVIRKSNVDKIQTQGFTLASGITARILFTGLHVVDVSGSSIPTQDDAAVANLAASMLCVEIAAFYADSIDGSLVADVVDHQAKTDRFLDASEKFLRQYEDHVTGGDVVTPALAFGDEDVSFTWGADLLTHQRRFR